MAYKRVLLKLSGEQLSGKFQTGIDPELADWLAEEVKKIDKTGTQIIIMVGGGNFVRGAQTAGHGILRVTADHMGMLATMINALALTDIFEARGVQTRCLSNIFAEQVAENFVFRLAEKHLEKGRVIVVAGGVGRPFITTDTAAVEVALELSCDVVIKATKVDGVYDHDPTVDKNATKLDQLTHQQAIENNSIKIMDKAALGLAMEHNVTIVVFDALVPGNLLRSVLGETVGTTIKSKV